MNNVKEKAELDYIASHSLYAENVPTMMIEYCGKIFKEYLIPGSILELGPAEGVMIEQLYEKNVKFINGGGEYTAVDGGKAFVEKLRQKFPKIEVVECLFEEFEPKHKYDNIVLGHVLEHVNSPVEILQRCRTWLNPHGRILAAVPNANSIHRQAAVQMGILNSIYDFSEKDIHHGHRRIFDYKSFCELFKESELKILKSGGYWLKPLSDKQIEEDWTVDMIKAFFVLGEKYPEISAENYVIATL